MSIVVSCGEISGDLYAADLIRELLARRPALRGQIWGMLGPLGTAAGGEPVWSYEELKLMGIAEVVPAVPRLLRLRNAMTERILERNPRAVVVVDSPDFHFSLVRRLRGRGYKGRTVFLVTPTVWAWRSGRTRLLRDFFDLSFPLFSFEHTFLLQRGVRSFWRAHPLVAALEHWAVPEELQKRTQGARVVALMPGSRRYDIDFHLTPLIETARILQKDGFLPVFSIAPGLSPSLKQELQERTQGFERWEGEGRDLLCCSLAAVGVSGTVAVESMLLRRFMVVVYTGSSLSWLLARLLVRIPYIAIPNYLTDKPIFPELLKREVHADRIVGELYRYLKNPAFKADTDRRMEEGRRAMGKERAGAFWAERLLESLEAPQPLQSFKGGRP